MVSSGQVTSDASDLVSKLATYTSSINDLSGSWKGSSYDGITSKANSFVSEYQSTIEGQMKSFAEALDLYTQYKTAKQNLEITKENYNKAVSQSDSSSVNSFLAQISKYETEIANLKQQIEAALAAASSGKLEATKVDIQLKTEGATQESAAKMEQEAAANAKAADPNKPFTNYYQYNYSQPYSQGTIKTSGCGPTSLAMVLTNLLDREVSPVETAAKGNGKYTCSKGTTWNYFGDMAKQYGVNCQQMNISSENIVTQLQQGKKLILSMGPGHFTKGGHFIVARGLDSNGKVVVSDPASESRSNQTWDAGLIASEGKQIWAFSA